MQVRDVGRVVEQALAAAEDQREHHQSVLVDDLVSDERVEKVGAPVEVDVPSRLTLQLPDPLDRVLGDDRRVLPRRDFRLPDTTYFGMPFIRSANPSSPGAVGQNAAKIS